jgi:zinc protease
MRMRARLCLSAAALLFSAPALAEEAGWRPETFELANGMQAVVLPDHRAPVVTHMLWYRVGSADEAPGKSGIAHLFEHLMFKATDEIPAGEFSKIVARNGGQDNAMTSYDFTAYFQRVAKDRLPMMMRMEADRMTDLQLTDEEVLPERDVVKEERRQRTENNPGSLLFEKVMAELYKGHPYAIPVIGFMDEVAELDREDALDFYREWYGPENAILVVAGDVTAAELKPLAEEIYGAIPRRGDLAARNWPEVRPLAASVEVSHSDPKVRQPQWSRYWLAVDVDDPRAQALEVAAEILGGGRTSRLNRALVEQQVVAVGAYAFASVDGIARGMFGVGGSPAPGRTLDEVEAAAEAEVARFLAEGPTEAELTRAKNSIAAAAIYVRDSQMGMAQWYGAQLAAGETVERIESWDDRIRAVTREDVMAALNDVLAGTHHVDARLLEAAE